jgi:hypothetical protein
MSLVSRALDRILPALLMASSVVLLSAGLFAYAPVGPAAPSAHTDDPGDPGFAAAPSPTPSVGATLPPATPSASGGTPRPTATPPRPSGMAPSPAQTPVSSGARATRIAIPSLGIDLPVVSGDLEVPGNRDSFPLCDVAQYLVGYSQPGEPGTTYIYAHARTGMFLPLLEQSQHNNGRGMIGALVEVYTSDNRLHLYEIYVVKRHATDLSLAHELPPAGHQLVLQTSEGPRGTIPKLQVAARPLSSVAADPGDARPRPRPRPCG